MRCMNTGSQVTIEYDVLLQATATVWYQRSVLFRGGVFCLFVFVRRVSGFCTRAIVIVK